MRLDSIEFPTDLIDAIRNDDLVVFAGAGVSMGAPAYLPDFRTLATNIGSGTAISRESSEPDDRYLGRLAQRGIKVHELACKALSRESLQPTPLHHGLLRLFSDPQVTKIVTTNFDTLFEKAASDLGHNVEIYRAPALPLGRSPFGVVHVHGSVIRCGDIVLTDADFGRAYLTEGWARRFLVDLFNTWTVLFVGYSHSDAILTYLARALPRESGKKRYALVDERQGESRWHLLGIESIAYPQRDPADHSHVTSGIGRLATLIRRSTIDWHTEVAEICQHPPPIDPEQGDLVAEALRRIETARPFFNNAVHPDWIDWLDRRGLLSDLFGGRELSEVGEGLAGWLVAKFATDETQPYALQVIARHGNKLSLDTWRTIARQIAVRDDLDLSATALSRWLVVLLAGGPRFGESTFLCWLATRAGKRGLGGHVLQIFSALLDPKIELEAGSSSLSVQVRATPRADHHGLSEIWTKQLRAQIDVVAQPVLERCVRYFEQVRAITAAWNGDEGSDVASYNRNAIEPHEQDKYAEAVDVVIDAARDSLEALCRAAPEIGASWVERLAASNEKILNRIAIYVVAERSDQSPDARLRWLLERFNVHAFSLHHEIWRGVRIAFPRATKATQRRVLAAISAYNPSDGRADTNEDETRIHIVRRQFEWLSWLDAADPNNPLVAPKLRKLQRANPGWVASEHPDLLVYSSSGLVSAESPWTADQLRQQAPREILPELLRAQPRSEFGIDRHGLVQAVFDAARLYPTWGIALGDELIRSQHWDTDLWQGLFRAWTSRETAAEVQADILSRMEQPVLLARFSREMADILLSIAQSDALSEAMLNSANSVAERLWPVAQPTIASRSSEWLQVALNQTPGILGQFWLHSLSLRRKLPGYEAGPLKGPYLRALTSIARDPSDNARMARSVLAGNLAFLLNVDTNWTRTELLPHFAFTHGEADFQAAWDGFSYWGRLNPSVADALQDLFFAAISYFDSSLESQRERLIDRFTSLVRFFISEPLTSWIPELFRRCGDEGRRSFAHDVTNHLRGLEDAKQTEWWTRWLREYWSNRLVGVPEPLDEAEVEIMLGWMPHLTAVFDEATDLAIQMPKLPVKHALLFHELDERELATKFPESTAKLVLHFSELPMPSYLLHRIDKVTNALFQSERLPESTRKKLAEMLTKKGIQFGQT